MQQTSTITFRRRCGLEETNEKMKTKTTFTPQEARKHFKAREVFTLYWKNESKRNTLTEANLGPCETSMMELFCKNG